MPRCSDIVNSILNYYPICTSSKKRGPDRGNCLAADSDCPTFPFLAWMRA